MERVELTAEAINCLKFWQGHEMYGGSFSDVILQQMSEWLNRDRSMASSREIRKEFESIKKGEFAS